MRLLLDTHVFIWWREDNPLLRTRGREAIAAADLVMVSAASAWETAIKISLGKMHIHASFERGVVESGFIKLAVDFAHAAAVEHLPHHHGDPFDRLLIAQAQVEGLTVLTHDRAFEPYRVPIVWA